MNKTLLLISSSYIESWILGSINDLFVFDIDELILLNENHSKDEIQILERLNNYDYKITLTDNYLDAIQKATYILIIDNYYFPQDSIDKIILESKKYFKDYYYILLSNDGKDAYEKNNIISSKINIPIIFTSNIGDSSQMQSTELYLNKMFTSMGVSIFQKYSYDLYTIITSIPQIIKPNVYNSISASLEVASCAIIGVDGRSVINSNGEEDYNIYRYIKNMIPEYVIIACESNFYDYDSVKNYFKYKYSLNVDAFVLSNYFTFNDGNIHKYNVFDIKRLSEIKLDDFVKSNNEGIIENNLKIKKDLINSIIFKVTLPSDTYYI